MANMQPYQPFQEDVYDAHYAQQMAMQYGEMQTPVEAHQVRGYHMTHNSQSSIVASGEKPDVKPRLNKQQVTILESHFQECNKPNSQVKRQFAERFNIGVERINNWFQNRRAKAKQMKKQLDYSIQQNQGIPYEDASSPEYDGPSTQELSDVEFAALHGMDTMPMLNGPLATPFMPAVAAAASAPTQPMQQSINRADLPMGRIDTFQNFPEFQADTTYIIRNGVVYSAQESPYSAVSTPFTTPSVAAQIPHGYFPTMATPTQVPTMFNDYSPQVVTGNHSFLSFDSQNFQAAMQSNAPSPVANGDLRFMSPPPPADLAARRSQPRPATLASGVLRSPAPLCPRSISTSNIPQRATGSPSAQQMRRVRSGNASLNASIIGSRIQKVSTTARPALARVMTGQREALLHEATRQATPSANVAQSFPPTPSSPLDPIYLSYAGSVQSSSPESEGNYAYGSVFEMGAASAIVSPPDTPYPNAGHHWGLDFDVDRTPGIGAFNVGDEAGIQMAGPQYVYPPAPPSDSQPVTPMWTHCFGNTALPNASPQFELAPEPMAHVEYRFPENASAVDLSPVVKTPSGSAHAQPMRTFTFNNLTQETLMEAQRRSEHREAMTRV